MKSIVARSLQPYAGRVYIVLGLGALSWVATLGLVLGVSTALV